MWLRTARHVGTFFVPNLQFIHDTYLKLAIYVTLSNRVPTSQKILHLRYNGQSVNAVWENYRYLL
jgi:hypothetical protein